MTLSSILIWRLEEPAHYFVTSNTKNKEYNAVCSTDDVERGHSEGNEGDDNNNAESLEQSEEERPDGCCLALRETTYDLKLD